MGAGRKEQRRGVGSVKKTKKKERENKGDEAVGVKDKKMQRKRRVRLAGVAEPSWDEVLRRLRQTPSRPQVALTTTAPRRPPVCFVASSLSLGDLNRPLPPRPHHPTN